MNLWDIIEKEADAMQCNARALDIVDLRDESGQFVSRKGTKTHPVEIAI